MKTEMKEILLENMETEQDLFVFKKESNISNHERGEFVKDLQQEKVYQEEVLRNIANEENVDVENGNLIEKLHVGVFF